MVQDFSKLSLAQDQMKCNNFNVTSIIFVYLNKTVEIVNNGLEQGCCCQ